MMMQSPVAGDKLSPTDMGKPLKAFEQARAGLARVSEGLQSQEKAGLPVSDVLAPGDRAKEMGEGSLDQARENVAQVGKDLLPSQFKDKNELDKFYANALKDLQDTEAGKKLSEIVGDLQEFVEQEKTRWTDSLSRIAGLLDEQNELSGDREGKLRKNLIGNLVHRIAELRTIHEHPDEVLGGIRHVEQHIGEKGKGKGGELDYIERKGDKHYIRDYKPLNLRPFVDSLDNPTWMNWVQENNYKEQIRNGANPYVPGMPGDMKVALRDFMKEQTNRYNVKLEGKYKDRYYEKTGVVPIISVRPYFVFR